MRELLGLDLYERGFRPLGDKSLVYAALANQQICLNTTLGSGSRIVEIGQTDNELTAVQRLLTGKQNNVQRLANHRLDCVTYVELLLIDPAQSGLSAVQVENAITRIFCMALGAWPLANKPDPEMSLPCGVAHTLCSDRQYRACLGALESSGNEVFKERLRKVATLLEGWAGLKPQSMSLTKTRGRHHVGCRHYVPHSGQFVETGIKLQTTRKTTAYGEVYLLGGIDDRVHKRQGTNFKPLPSKHKAGGNPDKNAPHETRTLKRLKAALKLQ